MSYESRIYIGELETQIDFAQRAFRQFEVALAEGDTGAIFYHAHHFVVHATNVDKLLAAPVNSERKRIYKGMLGDEQINLKEFRRLRNHLEHYEERLDSWIKKNRGSTYFDMNIVTGAVDFPYELALRTICDVELVFQGERYNLQELHSELGKIKAKIPSLLDR